MSQRQTQISRPPKCPLKDPDCDNLSLIDSKDIPDLSYLSDECPFSSPFR